MKSDTKTYEYNPSHIEGKWQEEWVKRKVFKPDLISASKPYYNLMMFPYPSAEGMHVGNMYAFTGADIYGRFQRMQGFDVFEPIGLDGFGIHSENYAIKVGEHPVKVAARTKENFYNQLSSIGNSYAWDYTLETYDPAYYKWTQWLFIEMFKKGLCYRKEAPLNYCPSCKTVLADEQVIDTKCERCGTLVEVKKLSQWFFKITEYAEKLLDNTYKLDWPQKVLIGQRNWIGKSKGTHLVFKIQGRDIPLEVFTTRVDTVYGVTAIVIAPDKQGSTSKDPLALEIASENNKKQVEKYISDNKTAKSNTNQNDEEKTGVDTGAFAINPFSGEKVPVWVGNYVVGWYGTGAVMVVPAHDERDYLFAKKYNLGIKQVIFIDDQPIKDKAIVEYGVLRNSGEFSGLTSKEAIGRMNKYLFDTQSGREETQYKLRDWIISRQRYWGAPIPMIYCESCSKKGQSYFTTQEGKESGVDQSEVEWANGWFPVKKEELPVLLPEVEDYQPKGKGKSPLALVDDFIYISCPNCGETAQRETDVCDTFLDSAWYFLRYPSVGIEDKPFDPEITKKWLPVSKYIGGAEHTVLHLLYSRFVTMALKDMGHIDFEEPFPSFFAHGLIIKDGAKMSKSKGNVVVPNQYIEKYGADSLRTYLMFLGPFNQGGDFRDSGMFGMFKFARRIWNLFLKQEKKGNLSTDEVKVQLHKTIKKATEDIQKFKYNTAIASYMEFVNVWEKEGQVLSKEDSIAFLKLLAPFMPYITEEIYQKLNEANGYESVHKSTWPLYDEALLVEERITIAIQVNGKLRGQVKIAKDKVSDREHIINESLKNEQVKKYVESRESAKNIIIVPERLINFVI